MPQERKKASLQNNLALYTGLFLVGICLILLAVVFYPSVKSELDYNFNKPNPNVYVTTYASPSDKVRSINTIVAKDKYFSVVIPKIGANAKVIANVDPLNSREYQVALTKGVAHAKGTATPDEPGNTFLFAHSSDSFLNANAFNAVFYLLNKLQQDDVFYIAYKEKLYKYKVVKAEIVLPSEINYYDKVIPGADRTATLMTCWPPATTLRRLIVIGVLQ
jgi:LPXTG-site transpeptidase (sortase) family protein